jgi:hypothetical protein
MLQFGVFPDSKELYTLLIWGDSDGIHDLHGGLRALLRREEPHILIGERTSPAILTISIDGNGSTLSVTPSQEPESFHWKCSKSALAEIASLVSTLDTVPAGHQYAEIESDVVEQVMISKGEYPYILPISVAVRST